MEMDDVKLASHPANFVEHDHVVGDHVPDGRVESQGLGTTGHQPRCREGLRAREKCNMMPKADEFFCQIGRNALRSAVEGWRYSLDQGGDLRNLHGGLLSGNRWTHNASFERYVPSSLHL